MLCDDIQSEPLPPPYENYHFYLALVASAQKFVVDRDFAIAADGLVENIPQLQKCIPFCRLPYPLTWIECSHSDRPHFLNGRRSDLESHHARPRRIGYLLAEYPKDPKMWVAYLTWSHPHADLNGYWHNTSLFCCIFDPQKMTKQMQNLPADAFPVSLNGAPFGRKILDGLQKNHPARYQFLCKQEEGNWGGELNFIMALLGLLNTQNVAETQTVDNTILNKKRERKGNRPLFSHKILKINALHRKKWIGSPGGEKTREELRAHFVRGHFKQRATGLFWWNKFMRGNRESGIVTKDYEIV